MCEYVKSKKRKATEQPTLVMLFWCLYLKLQRHIYKPAVKEL